jgi:hypothetical protein
MKQLRVLVACECSGAVRDAFANLGHFAMSCDLKESEQPGNHYTGSVFDIINDGWDLMIAHPPCTHLSVAGARYFKRKQESGVQVEALDFVKQLMAAPIEQIAIENPVSVISSFIRKPDQIIHPWQFGHEAEKTTCLWLKNLPKLVPTNIVSKGEFITFASGKRMAKWYADAWRLSKEERSTARSKTFIGIANAMAAQWSVPNVTLWGTQ